ncbi:MAG: hypothetical protein RLW62_10200, partial [Gammaproteobacteria bacterium]
MFAVLPWAACCVSPELVHVNDEIGESSPLQAPGRAAAVPGSGSDVPGEAGAGRQDDLDGAGAVPASRGAAPVGRGLEQQFDVAPQVIDARAREVGIAG